MEDIIYCIKCCEPILNETKFYSNIKATWKLLIWKTVGMIRQHLVQNIFLVYC